MTSEKACRKDKNQNIQVFVRLRPLNQRERDIKSLGVIEVLHNREVVVRQSQQTTHTKKFTFDRAFGPNAKQVEVYQQVVSPLIEEVLAGYNCTVFAYGQTGTGKTHTMVGEHTGDETTWQTDPLAGIIPRALSQLFDELRISNTEYTVRVSYLELYNEELFDLLSSSEDNSKLRIYEDITRKGSNIVNGLEEITVYNKNEVYKIMAQGQERKRVASTLMNAQSSRSHTVFTIVVHMKDNGQEGEELVKIGKLNLVDLAGSENISKAGSDNPAKKERARECVNINQSLLTLGRVITALVERHPHIPYRESKLTRILQESLGGRTKTSIIATISPGHKDLEETMSTLEYANRAKNIQNKPEINQKMTKRAILKEYVEEIDRLKRDLIASRDKTGVYLANETYAEMTLKEEEQRKEIQELLLKKRAMEEEKAKMENIFSDLSKTLEERLSELNATKNKLNSTKTQLVHTHNVLVSTKQRMLEEAHVAEKQRATEAALARQARELVATADVVTTHVRSLHDTVDKRRSVESTNLQVTRTYREVSSQQRAHITSSANHFTRTLVDELNGLHTALESFASTNTSSIQENKLKLEELVKKMVDTMDQIKSVSDASRTRLAECRSAQRARAQAAAERQRAGGRAARAALLRAAAGCLRAARAGDLAAAAGRAGDRWYTGAHARVSSLQRTHASFSERAAESDGKRTEAARAHRDARRAYTERRTGKINACIAEIEEEQAQIQLRLTQQLSDIEMERRETEQRLQRWVQHETEHFQQRLQEHLRAEREAMEIRLSKKAQDTEIELSELSSRISRQLAWQRSLLEADAEELDTEDNQLRDAEAAGDDSRNTLARYGKQFDEDVSAISTDMEVFSRNVVETVQHLYNELLRTLQLAKEQVEEDSKTLEQEDSATSQQFVDDLDTALSNLVDANKDAMDTVIETIEANNTASIATLTDLNAASSTQLSSTTSHVAAHAARVQDLADQVVRFDEQLVEAVGRHEDLEGRYLSEEYKVYSPTGHTPSRQEYRYPRTLAATSPRDTILARFRAARLDQDDECILVESEPESRVASDCESSLSEDSALFAAPSPPAPRAPPIVKCTSESDIVYTVKRTQDHHQGKENADRSISYKKPSKLRAPSSNKKPLVERNGL